MGERNRGSEAAVEPLTLARAARLLREGAVTAVELTRDCLARIEAVEPAILACVTIMAQSALEQARDADRALRDGADSGPLMGLPLGLKDLIQTRGVRTTGGSRVLADWLPETDATVARRLAEAGAVALCKTNTHEFAYGAITPPTRNPWDTQRVPGGSSGGSAAAVATGECLGALGTDTGGSIRIPAAACGVTGLKPTFGLVSRAGIIPLSWSLDHAGPIARTAEDCALLLDAIAGFDPYDLDSVSEPHSGYADALAADQSPEATIHGLRIGVPENYFFRGIDPDVEAAVRAAIATFAERGATVEVVRVPAEIDEMFGVYRAIQKPEAYTFHKDQGWLDTRAELYRPQTLGAIRSGAEYSASDYIHARLARQRFAGQMRDLLRDVDALMTPTLPVPAIRIADVDTPMLFDGREEPAGHSLRYTFPFDLTGQPALTVPGGFTASGLPIGLQIVTAHFADALALRIGHAYQRVTDWHLRIPPVVLNGAPR
ncbi:MAG TPA: amidase [Ktedonobacterales bacterium]|nr:amidase [Ktedonobacterales bacterium]